MANGNERIVDKLRKVLALTNSPVEGEAQAAAETLQRLLTEYNLTMADLEAKGAASRPVVKEDVHDLGKAAFAWKLDLAETMAEHYYCYAVIVEKVPRFIGRQDNVESLKMLYQWVIDQVRRIASEERVKWQQENGEHIDPLRWQLHFGQGVVYRLGERLKGLAESRRSDVTALVLSHKSEISDYMERQYGRRIDGRKTERELKWEREMAEQRLAKETLKATDIEAFYRAYPWEKPLTAEQEAEAVRNREKELQRWERNVRRRRGRSGGGRSYSEADYRKDRQSASANRAGRSAADQVNLEPFIERGNAPKDPGLLK